MLGSGAMLEHRGWPDLVGFRPVWTPLVYEFSECRGQFGIGIWLEKPRSPRQHRIAPRGKVVRSANLGSLGRVHQGPACLAVQAARCRRRHERSNVRLARSRHVRLSPYEPWPQRSRAARCRDRSEVGGTGERASHRPDRLANAPYMIAVHEGRASRAKRRNKPSTIADKRRKQVAFGMAIALGCLSTQASASCAAMSPASRAIDASLVRRPDGPARPDCRPSPTCFCRRATATTRARARGGSGCKGAGQ